jgi:site-specific DNA-methyltransferase (adenine-specific)
MAVAIEDAGFEVRDMIEWVYGSGFPKSHNIGKAIDKIQGNEREVIGKKRCGIADGPFGSCEEEKKHIDETKGNSEWEGWGTALKPSHESICMARKPLAEKTVAENVLKYRTGGINIDESRVGNEERTYDLTMTSGNFETTNGGKNKKSDEKTVIGRFPANLIHDNSEEVRGCFPDSGGGKLTNGSVRKKQPNNCYKLGFTQKEQNDGQIAPDNYGDSGNASRFFKSILYYPKASKSERNKGCNGLEKEVSGMNFGGKLSGNGKPVNIGVNKNFHPTVKPIALMSYLIKMITPKGGIVLDPFAGSGSTLVAAKEDGYQYI